jgi:shikimate kinase / 3-dehydroquinate synthase
MSHIFLYGPPGTGKSTIGKILAPDLDLPFVDLDRVIESKAGMSISEIMAQHGEPAFRDLESTAIHETVDHAFGVTHSRDKVIALGGGALLREENRALAEAHGTVIMLTAELETLIHHLKKDRAKRPLLAGDVRGKLAALLDLRRDHYSSFAKQIRVDGRRPAQNAWQVQTILGRFHLRAMGTYDVIVGDVNQLGTLLRERGLQNPIIVTDDNVAKLHAATALASLREAGFVSTLLKIPAGESYKTLETVQVLWQGFLEAGRDRSSTVIALGGGVIGDLAGFAASTYMRGIDWVCVPTTLLSMVDASLGGKTGFDLPQGKNLIGSFHPPRLVLSDPQILQTLPEAEFVSGLSEVVKHGVIADPELFNVCAHGIDHVRQNLASIVKRAMAVKIKVIEQDPYEKGLRAALNLGHTVGHAVELVSKFQLRHGEAVAIGMVAEARLAERLSVANPGLSDRLVSVLSGLGLPVQIPPDLPREEIIRAMKADKKKHTTAIRFALPFDIGNVKLVDVSDLESVF